MRRGRVTRDGAPLAPRDKVWTGDRVQVDGEPDPEVLATLPEDIPLEIVYEDAAILVVDKPAGLVVHPGSGNPRGTLQNALLRHAPQTADVPRSGIVHRLDKDTSGLLVVAKTLPAQVALVRQLQARTVRREYLALVHGEVAARRRRWRRRSAAIRCSRTRMAVVAAGRPARTHYRVRRAVRRDHPAAPRARNRAHAPDPRPHAVDRPSAGGRPGVRAAAPFRPPAPRPRLAFSRQALHAATLGLVHPDSGAPLRWTAPLPADMELLIAALRTHRRRGRSLVIVTAEPSLSSSPTGRRRAACARSSPRAAAG